MMIMPRWLTLRRCAAVALVGTLLAIALPATAATPTGGAGLRLAFVSDNLYALHVVRPGPAGPTTVAAASPAAGLLPGSWLQDPSWSPDGRQIAYAQTSYQGPVVTAGEIRIVTVGNRDKRAVVRLPAAGIPQHVAWSPDGRRIAFVLLTPNYAVAAATWSAVGSRWDLYVVDADGTDLRLLAPLHPSVVGPPVWSPDSTKLAFSNDSEGLPAVQTVAVDGLPLTTRISPIGMAGHGPSWSPDGRTIAFIATPVSVTIGRSDLWLADSDGSDPRRLAPGAEDPPAWSPDSRRIAFSDRTGIWVAAANGKSPPRRVTRGEDVWPSWSKTGDIAFVRNPGGSGGGECGLFIVRLDGRPRLLADTCTATFPLVWSTS